MDGNSLSNEYASSGEKPQHENEASSRQIDRRTFDRQERLTVTVDYKVRHDRGRAKRPTAALKVVKARPSKPLGRARTRDNGCVCMMMYPLLKGVSAAERSALTHLREAGTRCKITQGELRTAWSTRRKGRG